MTKLWNKVEDVLPQEKGWYLLLLQSNYNAENTSIEIGYFRGKTFALDSHWKKVIGWQELPSQNIEAEKEELSKEEKEMICESLNFYGNHIADHGGSSSSEKYWDLHDKLKEEGK